MLIIDAKMLFKIIIKILSKISCSIKPCLNATHLYFLVVRYQNKYHSIQHIQHKLKIIILIQEMKNQ